MDSLLIDSADAGGRDHGGQRRCRLAPRIGAASNLGD
jgi:hypothetical protein